ncbi:hypothetical protein CEXT_582501 [Caerostris extrusa]|uniref:Uncharacterized protein n=1 Tax=Caerostris extrusa TaxID=172846 RepID=A0AAV4S1D6_CAEEX|nr:hypothetical protein CEXT_582501 [Caerostris extrusa]
MRALSRKNGTWNLKLLSLQENDFAENDSAGNDSLVGNNLEQSVQHFKNNNVTQQFYGMKRLFSHFYASILFEESSQTIINEMKDVPCCARDH